MLMSFFSGSSMFERSRNCSRRSFENLWASSRMSSTFLPAAFCCRRNTANRRRKSTLLSNLSSMPKDAAMKLKKSIGSRRGSVMFATRVSSSRLSMSALTSVVLPVPTSPVRSRKPFRASTPYFSMARASLCFSPIQRNLVSVLISNGLSLIS